MLLGALLASAFGASVAIPLTSSLNPVDLFSRASISSGCSSTGTASCSNTSAISDQCCFETPGGLLLQPQFWDTDPSTGPSDSWTIHGLWPDNCDGTFEQNCDSSRAYTDIAGLLSAQGSSDTLDFMNTYWKNQGASDETLWEHEWAKHGTCMSTLETKCLPSGSAKGAEAVAYFNTVVKLFKTLPTYEWLKDAGITPSSSQTHTLADLTAALKAGFGSTPSLDCDSGAVYQVSYYYHLKGSVIDGTFVPINAPEAGSCPSTGIKYLVKSGSSTTTTKTTSTTKTSTSTTTSATGAPTGLPTKATIHAVQNGAQVGGLLSLGTWSTQTLATFTLSGSATSFTLSSSKGTCGVSGGVFACGSGVSSTFSAVTSGNLLLLSYDGSTSFSSDKVPSGTTVYAVNTGGGDSSVYTLSIVST
ncbi:ribonuclease T2 [Roridomyces roridus]|uniref:Ribonuclease T2-like n=1 Tax=Roridomyces roridus TaxID=1738132 RepID=A0AAD7B4U4_9AGAR|nr:ribonuclease T2 [Roridomyces roridus]